jgi:outer membrane protein assembly factor BamB
MSGRDKISRLNPLLLLIPLILFFTPHLSHSEEPGLVVRVNERVAEGVTLLWKAYVGKWNWAITNHPLIFGDRIYHASNGDDWETDRWDRLYCLSGDGELLWNFSSPDGGNTSLNGVVACPEFVVVGCCNGYVYCVSHGGELLWKFKTGSAVRSFSVGDVDGDGELEVVVGSDDNLYCIGGRSGKEEWRFTTGGGVFSSPAIGDVDGDGEVEVVVGSDDNLYCIGGRSGKEEWRFTTGDLVGSSPAIGDVDGDGEVEVLVGSKDNNLYCIGGRSGKEEWRFTTGGGVFSSPAIGDVDGDGEMEVLVGSRDENLYCIDGRSGKEEWRFTTGGGVFSSPAIGDVDGDGEMEVVVGSGWRIYCIGGVSGKEEWRFTTFGNVNSSPAIGDLDGDGRAEIAVASFDGWLYLLRVEKPCGEILWSKWHGDGFGTGFLENALSYGKSVKLGKTDTWVPIGLVFQPKDTIPPNVTLLSPNGGEQWARGTKQEIRWSAEDNTSIVSISLFYSTDGGDTWQKIATGLDNKGSYIWSVPDTQLDNVLVSIIAIDKAGNWSEDMSDSHFTIVSPYPGQSVSVNEKIADGITLLWKAYVGIRNVTFGSCLLFGDKVYHASRGNDIGKGDSHDLFYCLSSDGHLLWSFTARGNFADFEGVVASSDFVVVGCEDGYVYCLTHSGKLLWKFGAMSESLSVGDVDRDGQIEVIVGSWDYVYCLSGNRGDEEWRFNTSRYVKSSSAIGDVDGDGRIEVVVGSDKFIHCLNGENGSEKWRFTASSYIESSPAIGDVDGDSVMEVVVGSNDGSIYCLSGSDGKEKWRFTAGEIVYSSPAIGDVDGDGEMEIVVGSVDANIYCLSGENGDEEWRFGTYSVVNSSPAIGDIDGDDEMEIVVGSWDGNVYCLSGRNGEEEWRFKTNNKVQSSPAIGDIDRDGQAEIAIASLDGWLYLLRVEKPCGEILWARFHGDGFGTGLQKNALSYGIASKLGKTDSWMPPPDPGQVEKLNKKIADDIFLHWRVYTGEYNGEYNNPLIIGDRIYHASNGYKGSVADPYDKLYCFSLDGNPIWMFSPPDGGNSSLDGVVACSDFVVVGCHNGYIYAVSHGGELMWKFRTGDWTKSLSIGNVDEDGEMEVIVGSDNGEIYCLNGDNGKMEWNYKVSSHVRSSPTLGDVDGDGEIEIIIAGSDGRIYCLKGDSGKVKWESYVGGDWVYVYGSPALGDVDGDGKIEVIVGRGVQNNSGVYCISGDSGEVKWSCEVNGAVYTSPALGDVDKDGVIEIVVGSHDYHVWCLSGDSGKVKWNCWTEWGGVNSSPALGDIDGDGLTEVIIGSNNGKVYCLNGSSGEVEWSYQTNGCVNSSPVLGDINGDGQIEIVVASMDGWLYLFSVEKPCGEILWARWHGDGYGTGTMWNALSYGRASKLGKTDTWIPKWTSPLQILITSQTHPSKDRWYANPNATLSWKPQIQGIIGYYIAINPEPIVLTPDTAQDYVVGTSKTFRNLSDGTWVFQIRGELQGNSLTPTYSFQVNIDATPKLTSSTHPDPNRWYQSKSAKLTWSVRDISSVRSAYYALDRSPDTKPAKSDKRAEGTEITVEIPSDGEWYLHLVWEDELGQLSEPAHYRLRVDTTPPEPVRELSVSLTEGGKVKLRWTEPPDNASGAESYQIYRSKFKGALGPRIAEKVVGTEYVDESSEAGVVYYYTVMPVDKAGNKQVEGNVQVSSEGAVVKKDSSVSVAVSPSVVAFGGTVVVAGELELPDGDEEGRTVKIRLAMPSGGQEEKDVKTGSGGGFTYSYKPMESGRWRVKAIWGGDESYEPSESDWAEFEVMKPIGPEIKSVKEDSGGRWLKIGDVLKITVRQADDGKTAVKGRFSIGDGISGELKETSRGSRIWEGSYEVKEGDYVEGVSVKAVLEDEFGGKGEGKSGTKVNIDGIPPEKPTELSLPDVITKANVKKVVISGKTEGGSTLVAEVSDEEGESVSGRAEASGEGQFTLRMDLSELSDGELTFQIWCVDQAGNESEKATLKTEKKAEGDFQISVERPERRVKPGGKANWTVEVLGLKGFDLDVKLSVEGLPPSFSFSITPQSVKPDGEALIEVSVPDDAEEGRYGFKLIGESVGVRHDVELTVEVKKQVGSTIVLRQVEPDELEWGGEVTLSGTLTLEEGEPGDRFITLKLVKPSGEEELKTITDERGDFSVKLKVDEVGEWKVRASWEGDEYHLPCQSNLRIITVRKVRSYFEEVEFKGRLTVGEEVSLKTQLMPDLSGRDVKVVLIAPDGIVRRSERVRSGDYGIIRWTFTPDEKGEWEVKLSWDGDEVHEGSKRSRKVKIARQIGKALLVLGGVDERSREWRSMKRLANLVYKKMFLERGLGHDDIYYLSPSYEMGDDEVEVDAITSKAELRKRLRDLSDEVSEYVPLFVYLIGHGKPGRFLLESEIIGSDDYVTADELDGWLEELEKQSGVGRVVVIIDTCYSGSFVGPLSKEGRVVIGSTRDTDPALITGGMSFTRQLADEIHKNHPLKEALLSISEVWGMDDLRKAHQIFWFDANGDGEKNGVEDYEALREVYIPANVVSQAVYPRVIGLSDSVELEEGEREASFWVRFSGTDLKGVWCEIVPPGYRVSEETYMEDLDRVELVYNEEKDRYEGRYSGFVRRGRYRVLFWTEDVNGNTNEPAWIEVMVRGAVRWDVNGDGVVDILDLVLVGKNYGSSGPEGDVNGDGKVDILDLVLVGKHYGEKVGMGAPRMREEKQLVTGGEVVGSWTVGGEVVLERPMWAVVSWYDRGQPSAVHSTFQRIEGGVPTENIIAIRIDDVEMAFVGLGRPFDRLPLHALSDDAIGVTVDGRMVRIALREVPEVTELLPNYPNPFNPETWMPFRLARDGKVVIRIYDVQGRLVRELDLGMLEAGVYEGKGRAAYWDGRNEMGEEVSSGIYVIEFSVGRYRAFRKMCLVR